MGLLVSRQVAARSVVLPALCAGVFRLATFGGDRYVLRAAVTREEGLVGVSGGFAPVESEDGGAIYEVSLDITGGEGWRKEGRRGAVRG